MLPATLKQRRVERFVLEYIVEHDGVPPTVREIAGALEISPSGAHGLLDRLEARGRIRRMPGRARTVEVVAQC
jgi:DNA-binding MarR family transcriptional regulator